MPNFRKKSRFDEGDLPPDIEYQDWRKEDTRIVTVVLGEDQYADVELKQLQKQYDVVEVLMGGAAADKSGKLIVRVMKHARRP